ncbi:MAG TPA: hypothetical protein VEL76_39665, partial [Gemmataceae bacterium]|nr:hypothetical protein [Gemmataceae bacterium]
SIVLTPGTATVQVKQKLQFQAQAFDQFGALLSAQPSFAWRLTGNGSLSRTGLYTAPRRAGGPYTITASAGGVSGTATVTVVSATTATAQWTAVPSKDRSLGQLSVTL